MFHHIKSGSIPGSVHNEDSYLAAPTYLAVLDGATGLNKVHLTNAASDAQWLSGRMAELLEERLADLRYDISTILCQIAEVVRWELDQMGYQKLQKAYPSVSVSIVRIRDHYLEGYSLGDCPILLNRGGHMDLIYDDTVPKRDAAVLQWMVEVCQKQQISMGEARKLAEPILLKNRMEMNQESSYWIFEPTGAGIAHGVTIRYAIEEIEELALFTDGFFAFYDPFALADSLPVFMNMLRSRSLDTLFCQLRSMEQSDPDRVKFPRLKISDDATAVYAEQASSVLQVGNYPG